jgi:hypothetical protein
VTGITGVQTETIAGVAYQQTFYTRYVLHSAPLSITLNGIAQTIGEDGVDTAERQWWWKRGTNELWAWTPSDAPTQVFVSYYGEYECVVLREDEAEIIRTRAVEGTTGYNEEMAEEETAESDAITSADAKLAAYCRTARRLRFTTERSGLRPGQFLTVRYPYLGLNDAAMLIESMRVIASSGIRYEVTAIEGPVTGNWADYFRKPEPQGSDPLTLGGDPPVIILHTVEATVSDTDVDWLAFGYSTAAVTGSETQLGLETGRVPVVSSTANPDGTVTVRAVILPTDPVSPTNELYSTYPIREIGWFVGGNSYPNTGTLVARRLYSRNRNALEHIIVDLVATEA